MNESGCVLVLIIVLFFSACGGGGGAPAGTSNSSATPAASPSTVPSPLTGFEKDLQDMRSGGFTYIWIFSRKDGKPLDREDSAFLHTNAPQVVDWMLTEQGRKVIAGTNFNLEEGNLEALKKRFVTEDYTGK